jgi:heptosyltransferase-1
MRIAIVRLSALGDIVHSMIVLQFIKKHYPDSKITWIVENSFTGILEFNPHIDNIVGVSLKAIKKEKSPKKIIENLKILKNLPKFDLVFDIQGLIKSSIVAMLIGEKRCGFDKKSIREPLASIFYNKKIFSPCDGNIIHRNLDVVSKTMLFNYSDDEIINKKPYLFYNKDIDYSYIDRLLSKHKKNILLVIGSSVENKNYPIEKYTKIAQSIDERFLVLWGNDEEREKAQSLCDNSNAIMLPKIDLNALKYLISKIDLVVGNDTGPTHMAWALNRPSIVLFGYSPPSVMYETKKNIAIKSPSKLIPCKFDKTDDSIKQINENLVIKYLKQLINR